MSARTRPGGGLVEGFGRITDSAIQTAAHAAATPQEKAAAARLVRRMATSPDDAAQLLEALGLDGEN